MCVSFSYQHSVTIFSNIAMRLRAEDAALRDSSEALSWVKTCITLHSTPNTLNHMTKPSFYTTDGSHLGGHLGF